jgi:hypothetical protein
MFFFSSSRYSCERAYTSMMSIIFALNIADEFYLLSQYFSLRVFFFLIIMKKLYLTFLNRTQVSIRSNLITYCSILLTLLLLKDLTCRYKLSTEYFIIIRCKISGKSCNSTRITSFYSC